jgi:hypothetical protein
MRRPFVFSTLAVAPALLAAVLYAQTPPPAQTPPAQQTPAPPQPAAPKLVFTGTTGVLLIQIKPDQTAAFEEMMAKLREGIAKTDDADLKSRMAGFKVYKGAEAFGGNALYMVIVDPTVKGAEYDLFQNLQKVMTQDELRKPETQELFKKWVAAFAAPYNKVNLTPVGQ